MKIVYLYAITVIALSPLLVQAAQKRNSLEVYNISCQNFTYHVTQIKCNFTKVANGRYFISGGVQYDEEFGKGTDLRLRMRATHRNSTISYNLVDMQLNLCVVTSQAYSNVVVRKIFNELIRSSNYPFDCFYKADFWYRTENFLLTDNIIPVWAPFSNATVSFDFLQNRQIKWNYVIYFALIPKGKN